jgi:alpha-L-fucosidase 2
MKNTLILISLLVNIQAFAGDAGTKPALKLWYRQPADEWMKATPVGNGRLGAMIFGGVVNDRIALNEITMWAGQPDPNQEIACGKEKLAEIRKLFFEGKLKEGNDSARKYLSGRPNTYGTHIPVGDLNLKFAANEKKVSDYRRVLNLENAITSVSYTNDKATFNREYFCSNPAGILVIRLNSDKKSSVSCSVSLDLPGKSEVRASGNQLEFKGKATSTLIVNGFPDFSKGGVDFIGIVSAKVTGGMISFNGRELVISEADEAVLIIDIRTSYNKPDFEAICRNNVAKALTESYGQLKSEHIKDYSDLFGRVELSLGKSVGADLPTDERFKKYNEGNTDPEMCALFFQYNRYLLISCSRENSPLPANLQGLWNDNLAANMPWTCDYHLDINTQQNYWAANVANLAECNAPLFNYAEYLSKAGEKTASKVYGSPGWVAHTVTNVWGYTAPGEWPGWGLFPTAGTWIALHLWNHYTYTGDNGFLKNKAYPILKKSAEFFLDYMVTDPVSGFLMTGPSTSPENSFRYQGRDLSLSMMPACDRVFVYELFTSCISASEILSIDEGFRTSLKTALKKLPPLKISKTGEIQEWFADYEKAIPNHRHTTHLTALYPFAQISTAKTPELAAAASKTIQYRLDAPGWEDVEWSRANMINFFARLKESEKALGSINILLKNLTRENLLTISVAGIAGANLDIFVLDGNEAAASGISEMLIQSHEDYIEFIPALPEKWKTGYYKGLCVRGGATVDAEWENMKIRKASLKAVADNTFCIKLPDSKNAAFLRNGNVYLAEKIDNDLVKFDLKKDDILEIKY